MNHCGNFSSFGNGAPVVCPKPRRLNLLNTPINEPEFELLDLMLHHGGGYGSPEQIYTPVASSPPYLCGSPPSRVSNPLIQDARFKDNKISPTSLSVGPISNPSSGMLSAFPATRKPGYLRPSYGNKPSVRIEGFNCNRRNCSIPALA